MRSNEWSSWRRNGWWSGNVKSSEFDGKECWMSWRKGRSSSSDTNGSVWGHWHASTTFVCSLVARIRLIHTCRRDLKESVDRGIVQFAELMSPAPSVIRGPFESGFLESKLRPWWQVLIHQWGCWDPWWNDVDDCWGECWRVFCRESTDVGAVRKSFPSKIHVITMWTVSC